MSTSRKLSLTGFVFLSLTYITSVSAGHKVIYGDDDRVDLYDAKNFVHHQLARSTAAMFHPSSLSKNSQGDYEVKSGTLEGEGICSDARFSDQPAAAYCSGFLVGPDLLVTAGHCIQNSRDCSTYLWVFDYGFEDASHQFGELQVYKCQKIIERKLEQGRGTDYALIKLDKPVSDRDPLKFRKKGKVSDSADLVVIGHPSGLPTKIADGANVRTNGQNGYFTANLDTFGGNSGSAVFNDVSGEVEGILVRGEVDYKRDPQRNCYVPNECSNNGCMGEDVTRITKIKALKRRKR